MENGQTLQRMKDYADGGAASPPPANLTQGQRRCFCEAVNLTGQAVGDRIGVARLPVNAVFLGIEITTPVDLGAATLAFGDYANDGWFAAAAPVGAIDTPVRRGNAAVMGVPIVIGYDSDDGSTDKGYEDIVMVVGGAALPDGNNIKIVTEYAVD